MLLTIFSILMLLAIFFIVLGFSIDESVFQTIGFIFLFFLSATVLTPGNLEYQTGETIVYTYNNDTINSTSSIPITDFYDGSGTTWFGRWLALISGLGVALSVANIRSWIKDRRESEEE